MSTPARSSGFVIAMSISIVFFSLFSLANIVAASVSNDRAFESLREFLGISDTVSIADSVLVTPVIFAPPLGLFGQDFSSSAVVADYTSIATPNNGQFNVIGSTNLTNMVVSITDGALQYAKTGSASGSFTRSTDLSPAPSSMLYRFDLTVTGNAVAATTGAVFQVGSGFGSANSVESNADTHSRVGVNISSIDGEFSLRDIVATSSSATFTGTQTITWAINNSGGTLIYRAPDGSNESIANDKFDIWVGSTKAFNDAVATTASQTLTDLKFVFLGGTANIRIDNMLIDPIPPTPTSNTGSSITTSGFTANWNSVTGVSGYRLDIATDDAFANKVSGYDNFFVNGQSANTLAVTGLAPNTPYWYRVRAVAQFTIPSATEFAGGNSAAQNPTTATPTATPTPTHTVSSFSNGNGAINPATDQLVIEGATAQFTLTPNANYHIGAIGGTCPAGGFVGSVYTTGAIVANCTVEANFVVDADVIVTGSTGADGSYATVRQAFAAINANPDQTGNTITVSITGDTDEQNLVDLLVTPTGQWASLTVSPVGARTVTGLGSTLFLIDGPAVTIDGLNTGGNSLTLSNASTNGVTVAASSGVTVTRTTILGSNVSSESEVSGGTVLIGGANNLVTDCNIGPAGLNLPTRAVVGGKLSSNNVVSNNRIYDFFSAVDNTAGIFLIAGSSNWTVSGNRIYQTSPRAFLGQASYAGIKHFFPGFVTPQSHTITGNTIGFGAADGTGVTDISGSTNDFRGIDVPVASTSPAMVISNNVISGITHTTSRSTTATGGAPFIGITTGLSGGAGAYNITGNTIGSQDGTSGITVNETSTLTNSAPVIGIADFGTADSVISNNTIGGVTINSGGTGTNTGFTGILRTLGTSNLTVNGNTIGPVTDNITGSYNVMGMLIGGNITATGNTVRGISAKSTNTNTVGVSGIVVSNNVAGSGTSLVSQNTVHSLSNDSGAAGTGIYGISANISNASNIIERNFVHSLSMTSSSVSGNMTGIVAASGTGTYRNNMVSLGTDAAGASITAGYAIRGIHEDSAVIVGTNSFYHNSVYIGGMDVASSADTFALASDQSNSGLRNYRDNILWNARSNGSGAARNFAIKIGSGFNSTTENNDLLATGTGGATGLFGGTARTTLADWRTATGRDLLSIAADPLFLNAAGTAILKDMHVGTASPVNDQGLVGTGVTNDFDNEARGSFPDIGADEINGTFQPLRTLSVTSENGTVNSLPVGIDCPGDCGEAYTQGSMVQLTAAPAEGYNFAIWQGIDSAVGNIAMVTMNSDRTVTAVYQIKTYNLTFTAPVNGSIDFTAGQAYEVNHGFAVPINATPDAGYAFAGWTATGTGVTFGNAAAASTTVTLIDGDSTVTAHFVSLTYLLTAASDGSGTGTITSAPAGIICGADCDESYNANTVVELTATPSLTSTFTGWGGACTGTSTCSVTMDQARNVTATFTLKQYTLTYTAGMGGSITGSAMQTVNHGASSTAVTAAAALGYQFVNWSDLSTQNPRTDTNVAGDISVTANFEAVECRTLSVPALQQVTDNDIAIPVSITDTTGAGIQSVDLALTYDPLVVEPILIPDPNDPMAFLVSTTAGNVPGLSNIVAVQPVGEPGVIRLSMFGIGPLVGEGTLVSVNMHVIGDAGAATGSTTLTLSEVLLTGGLQCSDVSNGTLTVINADTTTTVTTTPNPSVYGTSVTFTAAVATGVTTGTVTFIEGGNCAAPGTILQAAAAVDGSGEATFTTSALTAGPHTITACYSGATNLNPSVGMVIQVVDQADQVITFDALGDKTYGDSPFTVSAAGGASGNPVTFGVMGDCTATGTNGTTITITGAGSCTVTASQAGNSNYNDAIDVPRTFNIAQLALTATVDANSRPYNGNVTATVNSCSFTNAVMGDDVACAATGYAASFNDENVGMAKLVTAAGLSMTGADIGNYTFAGTGTGSADITALELTAAIDANSRSYDGTGTATINSCSFTNAVIGDDVDCVSSGYSASFVDKNAGAAKPVTATGLSKSGTDAGNYTFGGTGTGSADITAIALTAIVAANSRAYNGNVMATINSCSFTNAVMGDDVECVTTGYSASFADENVGIAKLVTATGLTKSGADAGNYTFTGTGTGSADITAVALTATVDANSRAYNGNAIATINSCAFTNVVGSEDVTCDITGYSATFNNKNVGTAKPVSAAGLNIMGADTGNYMFGGTGMGSADITAIALTATVDANSRAYNGNAIATINSCAFTNVVGSENVTCDITGYSATFNNKNVGTAKPVSAAGLSMMGADTGNYMFGGTGTGSADITAIALTATVDANSRAYDGTLTATISSCSFTNAVMDDGVDCVTTGYSASFNSANVGLAKPVTATGLSKSGVDAGNYTFNGTGTGSGNISKADANCSIPGYSVTYDGLPHTSMGSCLGALGETLAGLDLLATTHTDPGVYNDSWTFTDITGNYNDTSGMVTDTITAGTVTGTINYALAPGVVPVPQVTLSAPGPVNVSTMTDGSGQYSLSGFGGGAYTVTPSKPTQNCMTVSNGIFASDASLVSRHVVHLITLSPAELLAAKVSGPITPVLSSFDASLIAQRVVGICSSFNLAGEWRFTPPNVAHPDGIIMDYTENYTAYVMGDINGDWSPIGANRPIRYEQPTRDAVIASVPEVTAAPGSDLVVPFRIDNLAGKAVDSYQFDIAYDADVISPAQVAASITGTVAEGLSVVSNSPEPGLLKVAVYGAIPVSGDGVYVDLRFVVTGGIGTSTPLTIIDFRFNDGLDEITTTDGRVTVGDAANGSTLRGRLITSTGRGVSGAVVRLASVDGDTRIVTSDTEGRFSFGALILGQTYQVSASSKSNKFAALNVSIVQLVTDVDLIAE